MDKIKIYTRDYYLAIKKKKVLPFVTAWVDLEHIVLSEISQSEKDKHHMIPLVESNEQTTLASKVRTDSDRQYNDSYGQAQRRKDSWTWTKV